MAPERAERDRLQIFAAEMSGLISDMGDVPDPGLDDLHGMAEAIRAKYEATEAERDEALGNYIWASQRAQAAEEERDRLVEQLTDLRRQMEELRAEGNWPVAKVVAERDRLREALHAVKKASLLEIRRAAFAPEIGTRMTEKWRMDIADACRKLEDSIDDALA
jgi:hypothetical protein